MRHRAISAFGLTAILAGVLSASASAGTYQVPACNAAPEGVNHSWTWASTDTSQTDHYAEHENCPDRTAGDGGNSDQEGGLSTTDALGLSDGAPPGTSAGWTFTAPTGTTIAALSYERYIGHVDDPNNSWVPALRADGTIVPGETCQDTSQNGEICIVGGPPGESGLETLTGLDAQELSLSIACNAPAEEECITGATLYSTWAAMYAATVTLEDTTPPTLTTPTGPLWEAGSADGYHKGTETVTVEASDIGGGVKSINLEAEGTPLTSYQASCDYTYPQPCPLSTGRQTLTLPTTELADGTHTLTIVAEDAAGNQSTLATEQITIDNNPPSAPLELAATPTEAGSSTFTATWADPPGQVSPITEATVELCPTGGGACTTPQAAPAAGPATILIPSPGTWTLKVWLADAAGNSDPESAAQTTLTFAQLKGSETGPGGPIPGESGNGGKVGEKSGEGTGGKPPEKGGSKTAKPQLHLAVHVHSRTVVVTVRCSKAGRPTIRFVIRHNGRSVQSGHRTITLKRGQRTTRFLLRKLPSTITVRVTASMSDAASATQSVRSRTPRRDRARQAPLAPAEPESPAF